MTVILLSWYILRNIIFALYIFRSWSTNKKKRKKRKSIDYYRISIRSKHQKHFAMLCFRIAQGIYWIRQVRKILRIGEAHRRRCCDPGGTPLLNGKQTRSRLDGGSANSFATSVRRKWERPRERETSLGAAPRRYNSRVFNKLRCRCNYAIYTEPRPTEVLSQACRISPSLFRAFWGSDLWPRAVFGWLFRFLPRETASENSVSYKGLTQNHRY